MYRSEGKNYWINLEWGNHSFEHTGTRDMISLSFNQINKILFMPEYDTHKYPFPPPAETLNNPWRNRLTSAESRMLEFCRHQLIFIRSESRQGTLFQRGTYDPNDRDTWRKDTLVQFISPETYNRFIRQLRNTQRLVSGKLTPSFPFPTREDVLDIEVYRYIDTFLHTHCDRLPSGFRESLALDCHDSAEDRSTH